MSRLLVGEGIVLEVRKELGELRWWRWLVLGEEIEPQLELLWL